MTNSLRREKRLGVPPMGRRCVAVMAGVAVLLNGCVNLVAVRKFAKTSAATVEYEEVVRDYVESLERQRLYQPVDQRQRLEEIVKERQEQQKRLLAVQKTLVAYLSVLGDLAADSVPGVDDEVESLRKALETSGFIGDGDRQVDKGTATAAAAIASLVGRALNDLCRQAALKKLIKEADSNLKTVLDGLRAVLDNDLRGSLQNEGEAAKKLFGGWVQAAEAAKDPDGAPPVARLLLEERLEELAKKKERLDAYLEVLATIERGHAELVAHVDTLDLEDLRTKLNGYTNDLKAAAASIEGLIGK